MQLFREKMKLHPMQQFFLRSVVNHFKFSLANFATKNGTASQIFTLFRIAVAIYETQCVTKVIAASCGGASVNHKFSRMHFGLTHDDELSADGDVVERTTIFFSKEDKRYIYFISDPRHLFKTARNFLNSSESGKVTHFMWNGLPVLIWNHINDIFWRIKNVDYNPYPKSYMNMSI